LNRAQQFTLLFKNLKKNIHESVVVVVVVAVVVVVDVVVVVKTKILLSTLYLVCMHINHYKHFKFRTKIPKSFLCKNNINKQSSEQLHYRLPARLSLFDLFFLSNNVKAEARNWPTQT